MFYNKLYHILVVYQDNIWTYLTLTVLIMVGEEKKNAMNW